MRMRPTSWPGLSLVSLIILLFWMSLYVYVPILPVYAAQERGASLQAVGVLVSSYGLAQLVLRVPYGLWSDRLRKRKLFVAGGFILSIAGSLGLALATGPLLLVLFRSVSGAAAATWAISTVWFASFFPEKEAVKAAGLANFINGLGTVLGSSWGGALASSFGWLAPFYVAAGIGTLALLVLPFIREERVIGVSSPELRLSELPGLLDRRILVVSLSAAVCQYATYSTTFGFLPILAESMGASRAQLGWLASTMQIANLVASIIVGVFVSVRFEKVLALSGIALLGLATLGVLAAHTIPAILLTRLLHGLGLGLSFPVLMGLSIKRVPGDRRALIMGVFQAVYALGMFAGPAISGLIAERSGVVSVFSSTGLLVFLTLPFLFWGLQKET